MQSHWLAVAFLGCASCISVPDRTPLGGDGDGDGDGDGGAIDAGGDARRRHIVLQPVPPLDADLGPTQIAITFSGDPDLAARLAPDGSDLLAHDGERLLPHEIEHLDQAAGDLVVWVRLESFRATGESLDLFYGGDRETANDPRLVFANAALVWHFGDFETVGDEVKDSAADVTGTAPTPHIPAAAAFGAGLALTPGPLQTAPGQAIYPDVESYTLSFWARTSQNAGTMMRIGSPFEDTPTTNNLFGVEVNFNINWVFTSTLPAEASIVTSVAPLSTGQLIHVSIHTSPLASHAVRARFNGGTPITNAHGNAGPSDFSGSAPLLFGSNLDLTVDEVRIFRRDRSSDDLRLERQNADGSLVTIMDAEAASYP